jgi:hypothetical protein
MKKLIAICVLVLSAAFVCQADIIYDFSIFNNAGWASDGRLNFTVAISDEGQNEIGFVFQNSSSISSSITDVYFDDHSLFESAEDGDILGSSGVSFSAWASPQSLPGGQNLTPAFPKKPFFSADSDAPVSDNGINPGEWLKIILSLNAGENLNNVTEQIASGGFRIGLHIQCLPNDDSVSAINNRTLNPPPIPEPATMSLLSIGALSLIRRKK